VTGARPSGAAEGQVVVIGGGLAGITAALDCADAGRQVTLLEAKPRLGGLTCSFAHGSLTVDNGQHVFLRCCTSYRQMLDRLGVTDQVALQSRLDVPVAEPGSARRHRISRTGLPAPLHLGASLLRYAALSPRQRLRVLPAALALGRVDRSDPAIDRISFGGWLARHGQDERMVAALWDLVGIATLNARAEQASLALAATVFQLGLLQEAAAGDIGWSRVPLQQLHGEAASTALWAAGAEVRLGTKAEALRRVDTGWAVDIRGAKSIIADAVVVAVPPPVAERLVPAPALNGVAGVLPSGWSERLGAAPIVNAHVVYDRRVLDLPFLAGLGSPVQWVFDRTAQSGLTDGQYVAVSLSAADEYVDLPVVRLRELLLPALADLLPGARTATVRDFFVTRERAATFRPAPGSRAFRPRTITAWPGVVVAGAHTDTGWPATMEGAVRSGRAAAAALLAPAVPAQTGSSARTGPPRTRHVAQSSPAASTDPKPEVVA
jgi:squalene-associated FAD-dependent desaturase